MELMDGIFFAAHRGVCYLWQRLGCANKRCSARFRLVTATAARRANRKRRDAQSRDAPCLARAR